MSSSEDDVVLARRTKKNVNYAQSDSDEDVPLNQLDSRVNGKSMTSTSKKRKENGIKKDSRAREVKKENSIQGSKSIEPQRKRQKKASQGNSESKAMKVKREEKEDKVSINNSTQEEKRAKSEESSEEGYESFKWWENDFDGEQKWVSLEHNGVLFPPPYEPLPSHVKLYYDGIPVDLPVPAEEVAGFFGQMLETDHAKNPIFQMNFFEDFLTVLKENGNCNVNISDFKKLDFSKMHAYFEEEKEKKKAISRDEKKVIKAEKEAFEEPYKMCMLNGHKEQVGNFRVEPPGLFRGRGAHPKTGKLKKRVYPEDITLNLSSDAKIPAPPEGHKWGDIKHDNTVTWLAMWKEKIFDSFKYVRFAANSSVKGASDYKKFETARKLKYHIEEIRNDYTKMLKDELMLNRQMATATYLIDIFALRAGGEKGEEEADTVGCCSLRFEHITLKPPNIVIFDFLGKDSIRFYQEVEVDKQAFKNLRIFKKPPKQPGDNVFDRINPPMLNKKFQGYMKGLTAKVFRTYNASKTMQDQLDLIKNEGTVAEKVVEYNAANRKVAILCNHQRTVSKNHENSVQKIGDKLKELTWQKIRLKKMIIVLEPKLLKQQPKYFSEINDLTKVEEKAIQERVIQRQREGVFRKLQRDNEKLTAEGKPLLEESSIKEKLEKIEELQKEFTEELHSDKPEVKKGTTVDKLKSQVETVENRIVNTTFQLKDKEDNSEVSLGTSKINYIDPRLTVMFSKKFNVPIEKLFTKTLRDKFKWAIESTDPDWRF